MILLLLLLLLFIQLLLQPIRLKHCPKTFRDFVVYFLRNIFLMFGMTNTCMEQVEQLE